MDRYCTSLVLYTKAKTTNMEMRFLFVLAAFTHWHYSQSMTASISGSSFAWGFFYEPFPVPPAKWAMIDVDLDLDSEHSLYPWLIMGIYTTKPYADVLRGCFLRQYGQLGNRLLFPTLVTYLDLARSLRCERNRSLRCKGKIPVQDYTPRNFTFTFGYPCDRPRYDRYDTLSTSPKLYYNITIHVTNETTCKELPAEHMCHLHMQFGAYPNLVGEGQRFNNFEPLSVCLQLFQNSTKFLCYMFTHKCDPESNQIIPACKEMCYDFTDLCRYHLGGSEDWKYIDCDYLPSMYKEIPCFYEPVVCRSPPPRVNNARILTHFTSIGGYLLPARAEYSCDEGFRMKGNKTIRCSNHGFWSTPPQCSPVSLTTTRRLVTNKDQTEEEFFVVSPAASTKKSIRELNTDFTAKLMISLIVVASLLVLLLVALFVIVVVRYKFKFKRAGREVLFDIELKELDDPLAQEEKKRS